MTVEAPDIRQLDFVLAFVELAKNPKKVEKTVRELKTAAEKYHKAASEYHVAVPKAQTAIDKAEKMTTEAQAMHAEATRKLAEAVVVLKDAEEKQARASRDLTAVDRKTQKALKLLEERERKLDARDRGNGGGDLPTVESVFA